MKTIALVAVAALLSSVTARPSSNAIQRVGSAQFVDESVEPVVVGGELEKRASSRPRPWWITASKSTTTTSTQ
ncbi:hypothetical protein JCM10212_003805 [Sporobolomyces blumeae]